MLPDFDENGFLPEGVWDCSIEEFRSRFAIFRRSDCRLKLFDKLEEFLAEILKTDWVREVIIDEVLLPTKQNRAILIFCWRCTLNLKKLNYCFGKKEV